MQFLTVVLVARGTDPRTAGAFFAATTLCLLAATVLRLDAGNGLVHLIARSRPSGHPDATGHPHAVDRPRTTGHPYAVDRPRAAGHLRAAMVPVASLSSAVGVVAFLTVSDPALRVLAVALPAVTCSGIVVSATRGFGSMRPTLLLTGVLQPVAQLVLVGTAVMTGGGDGGGGGGSVAPLVAAWALPYPVVLLLAWLWLRRRLPGTSGPPGAARELWNHTWPRSLAAGIQAVFQRLDIVVVAWLAGPAEAAVYTAATRFKVVGQLAGQGLAQAAQPRLVRALAEGDLPRARELYRSSTRWLVALTWPIWLGYAAFAPWLLGAVFGEEYAPGAPVALVLAATMLLATGCGMADVALTAAGHTGAGLAYLVAALTTTVLLDLLLVPSLGPLGAALGWAGGTVVKNLLPLRHVHRRYGLRPLGPWRRHRARWTRSARKAQRARPAWRAR
ncbi:lipopolysaccharide biosynthesis protein [Streptosporangium longisporum]|uniref:lipopolysaccharide biosynthesis protein n=1 Tax=Streptosporangium longisporum TaxID=46187 RepID=UPI0039A6D7CD